VLPSGLLDPGRPRALGGQGRGGRRPGTRTVLRGGPFQPAADSLTGASLGAETVLQRGVAERAPGRAREHRWEELAGRSAGRGRDRNCARIALVRGGLASSLAVTKRAPTRRRGRRLDHDLRTAKWTLPDSGRCVRRGRFALKTCRFPKNRFGVQFEPPRRCKCFSDQPLPPKPNFHGVEV